MNSTRYTLQRSTSSHTYYIQDTRFPRRTIDYPTKRDATRILDLLNSFLLSFAGVIQVTH